jgi:hypothetical protein
MKVKTLTIIESDSGGGITVDREGETVLLKQDYDTIVLTREEAKELVRILVQAWQ